MRLVSRLPCSLFRVRLLCLPLPRLRLLSPRLPRHLRLRRLAASPALFLPLVALNQGCFKLLRPPGMLFGLALPLWEVLLY